MKKIFTHEELANKAKRLINNGKSWAEVSELLDLSIGYIQHLVKNSYTRQSAYKKLLAKAQANKVKAEASNQDAPVEEIEEVILVESGFLMHHGVSWMMEQSLPVYIPEFCMRELESLAISHETAREVITALWSTSMVTPIIARQDDDLWEEPAEVPDKTRTIIIVAAAVKLDAMGKRVRLYTTSRQVEALAKHQGSDGITAIYQHQR